MRFRWVAFAPLFTSVPVPPFITSRFPPLHYVVIVLPLFFFSLYSVRKNYFKLGLVVRWEYSWWSLELCFLTTLFCLILYPTGPANIIPLKSRKASLLLLCGLQRIVRYFHRANYSPWPWIGHDYLPHLLLNLRSWCRRYLLTFGWLACLLACVASSTQISPPVFHAAVGSIYRE